MPDFYDFYGNSLILIQSEKGMELFEDCKEKFEYKETKIENCLQPNLIKPTSLSNEREKFWEFYQKYEIKKLIKKYGREPLIKRIKHKIKKCFFGGKDI